MTPQGLRGGGAPGVQHSHPPPSEKAQSQWHSSPDPAGCVHAGCGPAHADCGPVHGPVRAGCGPVPGCVTGGVGHVTARVADGGGGEGPWTEAWRGAGGKGWGGSGGGGYGREEAAPSAARSQRRRDDSSLKHNPPPFYNTVSTNSSRMKVNITSHQTHCCSHLEQCHRQSP